MKIEFMVKHSLENSQISRTLARCKVGRFISVLLSCFFLAQTIVALAAGESDVCEPKNVLALMERVADWQIAHPAKYRATDWTQGALYAGIMALDTISPSPRFREAMRQVGESNRWKLGPSHYNADDQCVGQMYAELSQRLGNTNLIAPMRAQFDSILEKPSPVTSLDFTRREAGDRWSWCDSLFMAPPAWTRLSSATGDPCYLEYAVSNWWVTSDYLYDTEEHLFYRDNTYFGRLEANGKRVFWGRGNGWVMGGLVRVLEDLPSGHPSRNKFVQQFREMSERILQCQQADGLWRSSLLDPEDYPLKETSGSGFYTYALAWGINEQLLEKNRFEPAVNKAWRALVGCVTAEGKLTHVQPVGADPRKFDLDHTDVYGVGAFLLAGSQIYRLHGGRVPYSRTNANSNDRIKESSAANFDKVIDRYRQSILKSDPDWTAEKAGGTNRKIVLSWVATLGTNGAWPDINYENQDRASWETCRHLDRLRILARASSEPSIPPAEKTEIESAAFRALDFWLAKRFQCPNWWWNQIGVPKAMCDIIVLLGDRLSGERRTHALEVVAQSGKPKSGSGANTIWIADLALQHGALTHDALSVAECSRIIGDEIRITTEDGIQPDYSFHQHDARLQQFAYGRSYLMTSARLAWQLKGTPWSIPQNKSKLLVDLAVRGDQWMSRGIYTVPATLDRSVSRPGALGWGDVRVPLEQLREAAPEYAADLDGFLARQNGRGKPLVGARTYPRSDFTVFHRPTFSFFVKTLSDRTQPVEVGLNGENLKGLLQNCGDYYLVRDGQEYFDLAPVWDWDLLPGVSFAKGAGKPQRQSFVGAVTDGASCVVAMDSRFGTDQKILLNAQKFWACNGDVVVCLFSDLNAPEISEPVRTAMDQCRLRGPVTVCDPSGKERVMTGSETNLSVRWVHHSGFAYAPLNDIRISIQAQNVSGSWNSINRAGSTNLVTAAVFLPVLEQGLRPTAASGGFVILSGSVADAKRTFRSPSWRVMRNDSTIQAVEFNDGTVTAVFHGAGELQSKGADLGVDKPCIVLKHRNRLWISDPTQRGCVINIRSGEKLRALQLPENGASLELTSELTLPKIVSE
jgi:chondroitin AC lyase